MLDRDYTEFLKIMTGMGELWGKELSEALFDMYWTAMDAISIEEFRCACRTHIQTGKFFPRPAELIESVTLSVESRGVVAYDRVMQALGSHGTYQSVVFDDPAIHATIQSMGGWVDFGQHEANEWLRKEFYRIYVAHARKVQFGNLTGVPPVLVGVFDRSRAQGKQSVSKLIYIGDENKAKEWQCQLDAKKEGRKRLADATASVLAKLLPGCDDKK